MKEVVNKISHSLGHSLHIPVPRRMREVRQTDILVHFVHKFFRDAARNTVFDDIRTDVLVRKVFRDIVGNAVFNTQSGIFLIENQLAVDVDELFVNENMEF